MTTNFLTYFNISKKYVFAILVTVAISILPIHAQIKYMPSDERSDADMGVERVARLFTATYESKVAKNDKEIRWIQLDLGEKKKIDGIKLLPKVSPWGYVRSVGFPSRFKIEVSDDPSFGSPIMYENRTREDFNDPNDKVCTFSGREI
ncbi:MAG: discoidin domain-containing protein, partial [Bacteroidetes bacterium]|nr:discoidin domain-containing protein [Bacteroidota bacterium]